jgi:hypothetical protein
MLHLVPKFAYSTSVRTHCPDCMADLAVLRVISGRAGTEYWAMQCTACDGIHLDILQGALKARPLQA